MSSSDYSASDEGQAGTLVSFADVTELNRTEETQRQGEKYYRALFDGSVIGMIVLDTESMEVVMANQAAAKILGFHSTEEGAGASPLDLSSLKGRDGSLEVITKELSEKELGTTHQFQATTKDGREIWISATGARIMHQGKSASLISFTDTTEQKRHSERLMMTDRLASIGELAAAAAHELNNPLTSVIGFAELLIEKDTPDYIRRDLSMIRDEAKRAINVTDTLLTFAQKHKPVKQPCQINDIIEEVLRLRVHWHRSSGIEVERHLAAHLPQIMVDYFQMQQVFINIVMNAEYFMIQAHNRGTLTVTTTSQNGNVLVSFTDDGPGIPPENLTRIFDPFFTTKEVGKGTGLGLSICHGIVAEHGGQIYAASQLGRGASILIELCINDSNHAEVTR